MRKYFFLLVLFSLLLTPAFNAHSQNLSVTEPTVSSFKNTVFAQVLRDMRRWEIITFGVFPFAMFNVTLITDLIRWNKANGFEFTEQGRRYAPWPLKSAGAVDPTSDELRRTILIAAGVSMFIATIDLTIVIVKRNKERKRLDSMPVGSVTAERIPEDSEEQSDDGVPLEDNPSDSEAE